MEYIDQILFALWCVAVLVGIYWNLKDMPHRYYLFLVDFSHGDDKYQNGFTIQSDSAADTLMQITNAAMTCVFESGGTQCEADDIIFTSITPLGVFDNP
jgi:hypothetical protein